MSRLLRTYFRVYDLHAEVIRIVVAEIKDFTQKKEPIEFRLDDDVYHARPKLNAGAAMKFAKYADTITEENASPDTVAQMLKKFFRLTLAKPSYRRMAQRIDATLDGGSIDLEDLEAPDSEDEEESEDSIDFQVLNEIMMWIMEQYGLRPSDPSQPSLPGPMNPGDGTSSTEKPQQLESTSSGYLSSVS